MEREHGTATRGKLAKLVLGAEAVEIKATIPDRQVKAALNRYGLDATNDDELYVYFFDTPSLELFRNGTIARARRRIGKQHDSTIKFRPVDPDRVSRHWRKFPGFKIEADSSDHGVVISGSLTMPVPKGLIKRVAAGEEAIATLFTEEQQLFFLSLANKQLAYSKARVMGPIRAWRWKTIDPALPWPLTAELWQRGDDDRVLEVSIKAPALQAAAASAGFMAFLAEMGAEKDDAQQAKTRWALEYFAQRHRDARRSARKTRRVRPATA